MRGKTRTTIRYLVCLAGFMVCFLSILLLSFYMNARRNMDFIGNYTREVASTAAFHVSDVLEESERTIDSIACLYGKAISSPEADLALLRELEYASGFDWIRFVDRDGTDHASSGAAVDVSDRAYFQRGMEGKTGVCAVLSSRVSGEKQIGLYAPVRFKGEICGVMVGFLSQDTIAGFLKTDLYGYPAHTVIVQCNGTVLGEYRQADWPASESYGASFGGLAALLSMLNSCASGVSVVNIDNGFGAGYMAHMINHMRQKEDVLP